MQARVDSSVVPASSTDVTPASAARSRMPGSSASSYWSRCVWQSPKVSGVVMAMPPMSAADGRIIATQRKYGQLANVGLAGTRYGKMPDTYTLGFKNFRSIEDATLEIAPLTVIYGPNGSGKSSLIYGLLTLRNS